MDEIEKLLEKGVEEVIEKDNLEKRLRAGEKIIIKHGADPTAPDLHLGHAVVLRKLREFQELGHKIVFIIGDFTARIGDPSGRLSTRPILSEKEIKENAKTYLKQVGKILNIKKTQIRYNSEWFKKEGWREIMEIAGKFTIQRILERDDYEKRLRAGTEITVNEILYPLMQAYDSVKIKSDVEVGGTDQKFNMLAGRTLQKRMGQPGQDIITTPLLLGTDGKQKMSKSYGNYIGIAEDPDSQYGKIMSLPDILLKKYYELLTELSFDENENPRDAKMKLAYEIVKTYHGEKEAQRAQENFVKVFQKKEAPEEVMEVKIKINTPLSGVLIENNLISSKSEFKRLVNEKAIKLLERNKETPIVEQNAVVDQPALIKVGKRKFIKIILK